MAECAGKIAFAASLHVLNIILLSIFISRLLINIVAGADTADFPNCIFAGTLADIPPQAQSLSSSMFSLFNLTILLILIHLLCKAQQEAFILFVYPNY